jgi:hypothetical protein
MLINVYINFPCCNKKSYRYLNVTSPCAKHFTINHLRTHTNCQISHNIKIDVDWNKSKTKLKATVKWLNEDPNKPWPVKYPLLQTNKTLTI